jgi:hypothetical protein
MAILPRLITKKQLAALMNVCTKTIDRMKSSGQLINSMKIRGKEMWDRYEFESWVDAGCPSRSKWEEMNSEAC